MRKLMIAGLLGIVMMCGCCTTPKAAKTAPGGLTLSKNGQTTFEIVIAADAPLPVRYAAEELQGHLKKITGADFPIADDAGDESAHEIIVGDFARLAHLGIQVDKAKLGGEGYVIRTAGPHLVIAGGDPRGTLYGVYGFLEDHLGCRWFTPDVSKIPEHDTLVIPAIDDTQVPVLEYREPFTIDCFDGTWCARNRMNSSTGRFEEKHGGKVRFGAGLFVHTFNVLMPPEQYFDAHPEYFSEIEGKRTKDHTQLCCTNEDVVRICTEEMRKRIQQDPTAFVYSLSQNDWGNYCQCAKCQEVATAEGSQMAPVLQLVNRVAEAIEKEFPDKAIETLAYQWTRKPCKSMRPRPNVIIRLCSIECCFMHPLGTCDSEMNTAFRQDAEGWAKVANRLWVWDYVTSFRHYMTPFPNLRVLDDNIRFFEKNNVRGIFEQDNYQSLNGELSSLGGYMIAKHLWNPNYGEDRAMNEFLEGVYGEKAAKFIRQYIDLMHDKVAKENIHANIWIGPVTCKFIDNELLAKADKLWNKAERAVADDPVLLERVQTARLSEDYAWLELNRGDVFAYDQKTGVVQSDPEFVRRAKNFIEYGRRAGVSRMDESSTTFDAYAAGFEQVLNRPAQTFVPVEGVPLANPIKGLSASYYEGTWDKTPDFAAITPAKTWIAESISAASRQRDDNFAMRFEGFFYAPQTGLYAFLLTSNDGSRMRIGDTVIENDGLHGTETKSGIAALKKGYHPIEIAYFQAGGEMEFNLKFKAPGQKERTIPTSMLFHAE